MVRAGLFVLSLATVLFEILLTRLFSATLWYHFAFLAISVAMFGLTAGALWVYLDPECFPEERTTGAMSVGALLFALTSVFGLLIHLVAPVLLDFSLTGAFTVLLTLVAFAVPFVFSGVSIALALTRFPADLKRLYAADLVGAALACALVPAVLNHLDAPTAVVLAAALAAVAAYLFRPSQGAGAIAILAVSFVAGNTIVYQKGVTLLKVLWQKEKRLEVPEFERWNSISYVTVSREIRDDLWPPGWGLSPKTPLTRVPWRRMSIDGSADTPILTLEGDPARAEHLKYDITAIAHHFRTAGSALVVGVGGGRDIQSALVLGQQRVTGVEINPACLEVVRERYADITGDLSHDPRVSLHHDEARSFLARATEKYNVIQISLIDTWAATAAGAYVLTENALYTLEAWVSFLSRLEPGGVLSVTRWAYQPPVETMRALRLARAALLARGVKRPRDHVALIHCQRVCTLLVSPTPFTDADVKRLREISAQYQFDIFFDPQAAKDAKLASLVDGEELSAAFTDAPYDLSPPTDDRPFFFQSLKLSKVFDRANWSQAGLRINAIAVVSLAAVLAAVLLLAGFALLLPLVREAGDGRPAGIALYFVSIGLAYMFIEMAQMQRLTILLGHPTYALTVVLGALLVSSGLGSLCAAQRPTTVLALLVVVLVATGVATPHAVRIGEGWSIGERIGLAIALVAPAGFLMGMPFPSGMKYALERCPTAAPYLWGANGAAGITASVVALVVALGFGVSGSFWAGCACYAVAFLASLRLS